MNGYLILVVLAAVLVLAGVIVRALTGPNAVDRDRSRAMRWRLRFRMKPGPGHASWLELAIHWSRTWAVFHGRESRPSLTFWQRLVLPATMYTIRLGRAQWFKRAFAEADQATVLLSPPRAGKSGILQDRLISWPGSAIVTSTKADMVSATVRFRTTRGQCHLFNPQNVAGLGSNVHWPIISGCADAQVATRRASALCGLVENVSGVDGNMDWFKSKAMMALSAYFTAADLGGLSIREVYSWCCRDGDELAGQILAEHVGTDRTALGSIGEISGLDRTAQSIRATMTEALSFVRIPEIADALTVAPGQQAFNIEDLLTGNGTLYLITTQASGTPLASVFRCLVDEVKITASMMGSRRDRHRLDPPAAFLLDECTSICPIDLPSYLSDAGGQGLHMVAVAHGIGALEERWGTHGAKAIMEKAGVRIILPGMADARTLDDISDMLGTVTVGSGDNSRTVAKVPADLIRTMPKGRALIVRGNRAPLIVKFRPSWRRLDVMLANRRPPVRIKPDSVPEPAYTAELPHLGEVPADVTIAVPPQYRRQLDRQGESR